MQIIFEDKNIIVVDKAPGENSQGDKKGSESLLDTIKAHMKQNGEGSKTPFVIHRLDRPVGGLMVYAKTKESASDLSRQVQAGKLRKKYLAVVMGTPLESEGTLTDYLLKDEANNCSGVVSSETNGAKEAVLKYRVKGTFVDETYGPLTLLEVLLITGRHHQIRVQLSHANLPIWGDTKYNPHFTDAKGWHSVALYAAELGFYHPAKHKPVKYLSAPDKTNIPWSHFF